ncbi:MAG: hypothetical protein ACRCZE_02585 [Candidatus Altimarinota bacterium]
MQINNSPQNQPQENAGSPELRNIAARESKAIHLFNDTLKMAGISAEQRKLIMQNILTTLASRKYEANLLTPGDKSAIFHRSALKVLGDEQYDLAMEKLQIIRASRKNLGKHL